MDGTKTADAVRAHGLYSRETLLKLYGVDILAAASSSALVSPLIAVVDRSIIENLNGKRTLGAGLIQGFRTICKQPLQFAVSSQFQLVLRLYFSTYITANVVDTTCEHQGIEPTKAAMIKFAATSTVNMLLCIYKDRAFTRMFGTTAAHRLPLLSYLLFATRDSMTVAASFTAPAYIARTLEERQLLTDDAAATAAQLICPSAVQFLSTPLHLYALDLYNRPGANLLQRIGLIRKEYLKSAAARIGRIGPAFGIGGVGNNKVRSLRHKVLT